MDFYSTALLLALVASFGALVLVFAGRRATTGDAATFAALAGLLLSCISGISHLLAGHRPGTPEAFGVIGFVREHPALFVGAGAALTALILARRKKSNDPSRVP